MKPRLKKHLLRLKKKVRFILKWTAGYKTLPFQNKWPASHGATLEMLFNS